MTWVCPAYGYEIGHLGAICFFGEKGQRTCPSEEECHRALHKEREWVFARIRELADDGDPDMAYLAEKITSPDQLLGGPESTDP